MRPNVCYLINIKLITFPAIVIIPNKHNTFDKGWFYHSLIIILIQFQKIQKVKVIDEGSVSTSIKREIRDKIIRKALVAHVCMSFLFHQNSFV